MSEWRRVRLDWIATELRETIDPARLGKDIVFHYSIPTLDELGDGREEPASGIGSQKLLLHGGEVLVSKLNPRISRVLEAEAHDVPTLSSTEFIALRPGPGADTRFLLYWLENDAVRQFLHGATLSVTRSQQRVRPAILTKSWLEIPSLGTQRAIADYLDTETARIDALIEKKRRMVELLEERATAQLLDTFDEAGARRPLRAMADVALGRQRSPATDSGPHMVPYLRAANVKDGFLNLTDVKEMNFTPAEQGRFALRAGDVLVTEGSGSLASVGASCAWNEELGGIVCFQNTLLRLRPKAGVLGSFIEWWCRFAFHSGLFAGIAGGANIYHLGAESIRSLPCVIPSIEVQRGMVGELDLGFNHRDHAKSSIESQIDLLVERRQALITAAVTGELAIPGVAA